jgi:hypothetical protein
MIRKKQPLVLLLLLTVLQFSNQLVSAQSANVRGMYIRSFDGIIGNRAKEDSILVYAQANAFNYLCLYGLGSVNFSSATNKTNMAAFINRAKTTYGITQVGAAGEIYSFFKDNILPYNQSRTNAIEKFDVFNFEFEFWVQNSITNLYCSKYLTPRGYSCDTAGAFKFSFKEFKSMDSLAAAQNVISEIYLGWPNAGQVKQIAALADRILLHAYRTTDVDVFAYSRNRLIDIASIGSTVNIIPIFSSEPSFMGTWLNTNNFTKAYNSYVASYFTETGTWKSNINIVGYHWFNFTYLPKSTKAALITSSGSTTINSGSSVTLTAPAGTAYLWSPGNQTTRTLTVSAAGNYSCRVTNSSGPYTYTPSVTIKIATGCNATTPTITASGPVSFCSGANVTLTSTTANGYLWSNGATTRSITVNSAGTYTVRGYAGANCYATSAATTVTVNALPSTPTISLSGSATICAGQSVTMSATAGTSYLWSNNATTRNITVNTGGTYWVRVYNANGCYTQSANQVITVTSVATPPTITPSASTDICPGTSVVLTATAGNTYAWSNGATTRSIVVSTAGSYAVSVNYSTGCTGNSTATNVTIKSTPATPSISTSGSTNLTGTQTVTLTATTASAYKWTNNATTRSITVSAAGSYRVTTTASNGCNATSNVTVVTTSACTPPAVPTISASGTTTLIPGQTVTLTSTTAGGHLWSNGETTRSITVSAAGTYTVRAYNAGNCFSTSLPVSVISVAARVINPEATTLGNIESKIYPNPVTDIANIAYHGNEEGNLVAHILDLSGRLIQETNLQVQEGENIFQLDLASLSKGNYLIVLTQNQRRETLKVIKQ